MDGTCVFAGPSMISMDVDTAFAEWTRLALLQVCLRTRAAGGPEMHDQLVSIQFTNNQAEQDLRGPYLSPEY
ncbi:MAG TPA: hypothetical protein VK667_14510 [Ktedonobacteraceae bacterium]|nr:hypothetical protein [Ktedonobacteraceae bacterium]